MPKWLFRLPRLRWLAVNFNALSELPAEIGNCRSMEILTLCKNELTSLPQGQFTLPVLSELMITDNPIRSLPPLLGGLPKVTHLNLSANKLPDEERARLQKAYPALQVLV